MLLMVKKGIIGGLFYSISRYVKANNKYTKDYHKISKSSYLKYWGVNNLYNCLMSQKLLVNGFKWIEHLSKFNEYFIKYSDERSNEGYFLEVDVQYSKNLHELHNDLLFLLEINKVEKAKKTCI